MKRFPVTQIEFLRERQKLVKYQVVVGLSFCGLFFLTNSLISPEHLGISFRESVLIRFAVILGLTLVLIQLPIVVAYRLKLRCPGCGRALLSSYRARKPIDETGCCAKCGERIIRDEVERD